MNPKKNFSQDSKDEENHQRTKHKEKFLKKPKNQTAKKQYFKELLQKTETAGAMLVKNDLETVAAIFKFADITKKLDLRVTTSMVFALVDATDVNNESAVETFFYFARHKIIAILFQLLIDLNQNDFSDYKPLRANLIGVILSFFNMSFGLKRVEKVLRNTERFEIISQPAFWEPIYFSPKIHAFTKLEAIWFSIRISHQKSFTEKFIQNYVEVAKKMCEGSYIGTVWSISQIILESEQREILLKLVSDLPEKSEIIPRESWVDMIDSSRLFGKARALMSCANCKVSEKSEKEFQKCSRCGFVFYCSKPCQRIDWPNHKQICKKIKKQN